MRLVLVAAAVVFASLVSSAGPGTVSATDVITVTTKYGGVQVGTAFRGQPLVGASADIYGVCAGISYQSAFCLPSLT